MTSMPPGSMIGDRLPRYTSEEPGLRKYKSVRKQKG